MRAQAVWPVQWELTGMLADITFLGLFPVGVALNIWGYYLRNKKIIFHVDNQAVVYIINKISSRSPRVMSLVRKLVFACLEFNILLKSEHIPGYLNSLADSLSRCDFWEIPEIMSHGRHQPLCHSTPFLELLSEETDLIIKVRWLQIHGKHIKQQYKLLLSSV